MASGYGGRMFATDIPAFRQQAYGQWGDERQGQMANYRANVAADAAKFPAQLQQDRFNRLLPSLQSALNGGGAGDSGVIGGASTAGPRIDIGPIWNEGQIQQQVNAGRAMNDRRLGGNLRQIRQSTAGRGFGANSPLQMALSTQARMGGAAANADLGRNVRWDSAQGNAQHRLSSQQAAEVQHSNRMQEDIERRKNRSQYQSSIIQALAGLA